jgi:DNA (cytosine-5)-methyltransferase 1
MRIGSLFSGIGGLELGLERAGLGDVVWQVEINPFCRQVLRKHWPGVQQYADIQCASPSVVDLICGGFPCQDVSSAGKRAGLAGARSGLWFEYLRIVSELRPQWVVVENVASGAHAWVDTVLAGLGEQGYACLPIPIAAADVGAPHLRRRIFIIAHLDQGWEHARAIDAEVAVSSKPVADADHAVVRLKSVGRSGQDRHSAGVSADHGWQRTQPRMVRVVHGVFDRLDGARARVAALGNSVVPQCAEVIGHVIKELTHVSPG